MCKCTPAKRTPFCGAPGCTPPEQVKHEPIAPREYRPSNLCFYCTRGPQDHSGPEMACPPAQPALIPARLTDRVTVAQLDKYMATLRKDTVKLLSEYANNDYLQAKARELDAIVQLLSDLRRDKQMTTIGGRRLE